MPATATPKSSPAAKPFVVGEVSQRLADLEATAADAAQRVRDARADLRLRSSDAAREIAADLVKYHDAIESRKPNATPEADRPARELELTVRYCEAVQQRGLVLMPMGQGTEVKVFDPKFDRAYDAAFADQLAANRAVEKFKGENAEALDAERRRADAEDIRGILGGDDGDAIREAFTTRDLPGIGTVHRRHQRV